jgi:hypothetical protein
MSELPDRELVARALYNRRPFCISESGSVMDPFMRKITSFEFEAAPAFYQAECYELADAMLGALYLAGRLDPRAFPAAEAA